MRVHLSSLCKAAILGCLVLGVMASPALAVGPGLPAGYQVTPVDSPIPATTGLFGTLNAVIGDVNGDGKEDWVTVGTTGSLNNNGVIWEFSGANGQLLRSANAPDPAGQGDAAYGGDRFLARMGDIGSCPNAPPLDPTQVGPTCASNPIGPPDGAGEILVGAGGVDVGGLRDVGRVYVLDGKTLAVLKRIDMPPGDRALLSARAAENPGTTIRGGFGRTANTPRGLPACAGNAGVSDCPSLATMPQAVRIGDMDGGGQPDVVVGANRFSENGTTANPASHCAKNAGANLCLDAGRVYIYRGEDIANSDPSVILDGTAPGQTPPKILKSLAAQADDLNNNLAGRIENFGHSEMPVGDLGACRTGGAFPAVNPGDMCTQAARTTVPDGKPDVIIAAQRADGPDIFNPNPAYFEEGASFLIDGATGAVLYIYNHPEPTANALFGFTTGQTFAVGDLGDTSAPDAVIAAFQDVGGKAQAGRAYVFSGTYTANFIMFALMDDPKPQTFARFANPTEGVGDLVPETPRNEVLTGHFTAVQTAGQSDTLTDANFMNPVNAQNLQTITDPAQQKEDGFSQALMPLGDLNGDGFLDFAVAAPRWNSPASGGSPGVTSQGRIYIFRSDNSKPSAGGSPNQPSTGGALTAAGTVTTTPGPDKTPPTVSNFGMTNTTFVAGGGPTPTFGNAAAKKHNKGTTFRYTLSEAATVNIAIDQRSFGRRNGRRCVRPTRKLRKKAKCILRIVRTGALMRTSHPGVNSVAFSGRIGSKTLRPGNYVAVLVATDAAKNVSKPKTISFTVARR